MAAPVDTAMGGEEGSDRLSKNLKQIIQSEFKDSKVSNDIYSTLVDMEIEDIQTLILTDEADLNDLCKDMNLKGSKKIKFKALIRKQKQLYQSRQPQPQHIVTISQKEQAEIDTTDAALTKANSVHHLLETHFNEIEQHTEATKSAVNQQFAQIFKVLQARQKTIINKIDEWKLNKLEAVNKETSNIIAYNEELKQVKKEIYALLSKDRSVMEKREKKIGKMVQTLSEKNQYYQIFNDMKLFQQYINNNTKLMGLSFQETICMNKLNEYGTIKVDKLNNQYKLPSIVLSDIEKTKENKTAYDIKIGWKMISKQKNLDSDAKKSNDSQFIVKYKECYMINKDMDEKKELYTDEANSQTDWNILDDIKIQSLGDHIFAADVVNYCVYDTVYKFKVSTMIGKPIQTIITSPMKQICCSQQKINLDMQQIKQIPLKIHSDIGHWSERYKPERLLESNDNEFCSQKGMNKDVWIIFDIDSKPEDNSCYYPVNIKLRAYSRTNSLKGFEVYIGCVQQNEWIKLHENVFTALKDKQQWQEFTLDIARNNNVANELNRKWLGISDNNYTQLKLLMKNNYGYVEHMKITEFKIFGVKT